MLKEEENKKEIVNTEGFEWIVPECCREGWPSCPHTVKRPKPKKRNIGL